MDDEEILFVAATATNMILIRRCQPDVAVIVV